MTSALYVQTRKEVRALLPWWLGVVLATVAMSYVALGNSGFPKFRYEPQVWLAMVYAAGVLALAALSVGQELTHGTLASLLVQPVDRRRVLWTKVTVLAAMVVVLGTVGELMIPNSPLPRWAAARPLTIWGPVAIGIGLVPLFTLLTRKPVAGPVFGVVVPGLIYMIAGRYFSAGDTDALAVAWYGTLVISTVGFVGLSFLFPRAQVAGDGQASSLNRRAPAETPAAPLAAARGSSRERHWVWLSIVKEVRLQQLTFAVSGLFLLLGAVIVIAQRMDPPYAGPGIGALAVFHGVFVAIIAGSRASAEERHLGVLAAQTLHPRAAWQQWFLKVSVTLSIVLVLAIALPWLFRLIDADKLVIRTPHGLHITGPASDWFGLESEYFVGVALACLAALYVSSLSANSLWALLACLPVAGVVLAVMAALQPALLSIRRDLYVKLYASVTPAMRESYRGETEAWRAFWTDMRLFRAVEDYLTIILTASFTIFVLYLAHRNHRTLERGTRRIAIQAGMMAASLVLATAAYFGASHLAWSIIR
jgi:hypothetical protein